MPAACSGHVQRCVTLVIVLCLPLGTWGWADFMTDVTTYCYQHLFQDAGCCKDQRKPEGVTQQDVLRQEDSWECVSPAEGGQCMDAMTGQRGQDTFSWMEGADCATPRVLFVHGGGFERDGPKEASYDVLAAKLASVANAAILMVDFPLVPVGDHVSILNYLTSAWQWLSMHGPDSEDCSQAPLPPMFVAGDSSGAAAALSFLLSLGTEGQASHAKANGFFAFSPWINLACDTPTYYSNAFAMVKDNGEELFEGDILFRPSPGNNTVSLRSLAMKYLTDNERLLRDSLYSPFHAKEEQLDKLPPAYIALSGSEILAGDGIIFAQRLASRGIPAYLDIFPGMWHRFEQTSEGCGSGTELWQGQQALSHAGDFVQEISNLLHYRNSNNFPHGFQTVPRTNIYFPHPNNAPPWSPVRELSLGLPTGSPDSSAANEAEPGLSSSSAESSLSSAEQVSISDSVAPPSPAPEPPQLSMVAPRALPLESSCQQETLIGATMTGMLAGSILTFSFMACAACILSRRSPSLVAS